jgi:alpha-L-fucosidase
MVAVMGSEWFDGAGFGMFVHWGFISQRGMELSWPLVGGAPVLPYSTGVDVDDYYSSALEFAPNPQSPRQWLAAAREAGMRYAILTTRHHDGFALWPSKYTDFSIAATPYGADLVAEFVAAARAENVRVGFYLSLSDWHHPDYPPFAATDTSYVAYLGRRSSAQDWSRYVDCLFGQVQELLTNYGPVDVLWFDGQWERTAEEWRAAELRHLIRSIQPDTLVNDRLSGQGDFITPEQSVPPEPLDGKWETCMTMNRTWGFHPGDEEYKSPHRLVHTLCETVAKGGNLLLNVSPRGDGTLPPEQLDRLAAVGAWMARNGEAIHDTTPGLEPWQFYGPSTRKGDRLFAFLLMKPYETVAIRGVHIKKVAGVKVLATGEELAFTTNTTAEQELLGRDPIGEVVIDVPERVLDPLATVLEVTIEA